MKSRIQISSAACFHGAGAQNLKPTKIQNFQFWKKFSIWPFCEIWNSWPYYKNQNLKLSLTLKSKILKTPRVACLHKHFCTFFVLQKIICQILTFWKIIDNFKFLTFEIKNWKITSSSVRPKALNSESVMLSRDFKFPNPRSLFWKFGILKQFCKDEIFEFFKTKILKVEKFWKRIHARAIQGAIFEHLKTKNSKFKISKYFWKLSKIQIYGNLRATVIRITHKFVRKIPRIGRDLQPIISFFWKIFKYFEQNPKLEFLATKVWSMVAANSGMAPHWKAIVDTAVAYLKNFKKYNFKFLII